MVDKIGDKKLRGVRPTAGPDRVEDPEAVSSVGGVNPASRVGETGGVRGITKRRPTREMTAEERETCRLWAQRAAMEATEAYRQAHNLGRGGGVTNGWMFWSPRCGGGGQ